MKRNAAKMKNVLLREPVFNILPYFQSCDIHILLSEREGMPNSVLEGMSCQLPTVVTAVPGLGSIVESGVDGYVLPVADKQAAAEAIIKLAENKSLRERMGLAARQKTIRNYEIKTIVKDCERMYRQICKKGGAKKYSGGA